MIQFEPYASGELFGIRYRLTSKGDSLPSHTHEADMAHNIIVLSGRVRFSSDAVARELSTGQVFDFDGARPHTIECVEPGSVILNLLLHGRPAAYAHLANDDLQGVVVT